MQAAWATKTQFLSTGWEGLGTSVLDSLWQYRMRNLPGTSTRDQLWELNPRPFDFESNSLSTRPHAPTSKLSCVLKLVNRNSSTEEILPKACWNPCWCWRSGWAKNNCWEAVAGVLIRKGSYQRLLPQLLIEVDQITRFLTSVLSHYTELWYSEILFITELVFHNWAWLFILKNLWCNEYLDIFLFQWYNAQHT